MGILLHVHIPGLNFVLANGYPNYLFSVPPTNPGINNIRKVAAGPFCVQTIFVLHLSINIIMNVAEKHR
jgi:hypothetical protein